MSERDEQILVFDVLKLNEKRHPKLRWIHASMNGVYSASGKAAAMRRRQGQKAGISDICIPIPNKISHGAYIEMKIKPNTLTVAQGEFLDFVAQQGYAVKRAYSANQALEFIEDYLGIRLVR